MKNTLVRVLAVVLLVQSGCALCVLHSVTTDELPATMSESSNGRQVKAGNRATVRIEKGKVTGCTPQATPVEAVEQLFSNDSSQQSELIH